MVRCIISPAVEGSLSAVPFAVGKAIVEQKAGAGLWRCNRHRVIFFTELIQDVNTALCVGQLVWYDPPNRCSTNVCL